MKLYEIADIIEQAVARSVDPETGELAEGFEEELDKLVLAFEDKCEAVACYIKGEELEGEAIDAEAKRLKARASAHHNRAHSLKKYLEKYVSQAGIEKLETPKCRLSWRKSNAVVIEDEVALPNDCKTATIVINRAKISERLRSGQEVPGARFETRKHLQIK